MIRPEDSRPVLETQAFEGHTEQAKNYLADCRGELLGKVMESESPVVYGPVVDSSIGAAEQRETDLIALAGPGRRRLSRELGRGKKQPWQSRRARTNKSATVIHVRALNWHSGFWRPAVGRPAAIVCPFHAALVKALPRHEGQERK